MFSKMLLFIQMLFLSIASLSWVWTNPSSGQDVTWIGRTDSFWHTPDNWDLEVVPGASDIARVDVDPETNALVLLDNTAGGSSEIEVGQLHVDVGDEVRVNGRRLNITNEMVVNDGLILLDTAGGSDLQTYEQSPFLADSISRFIFSQSTVRNAALITDSGTGSVLGQFEELFWEDVDLQGFAQPVEVTYTGDLHNTGRLQIVNAFQPNLVLQTDVTVFGDGEINFPDGGPNVIGDFTFTNDGNTLSGSGTFAPISAACTGADLEPSDDFDNNINTRETGVMEFRCTTTLNEVCLQIQIEGNKQNDNAPNAGIVNTHQDANEFLRVIKRSLGPVLLLYSQEGDLLSENRIPIIR